MHVNKLWDSRNVARKKKRKKEGHAPSTMNMVLKNSRPAFLNIQIKLNNDRDRERLLINKGMEFEYLSRLLSRNI